MIDGRSSVFADLEVAEPGEALVKAELVHTISTLVAAKHLTQTRAAELLCIGQPKGSALMQGRLNGFSLDRLLHFLLALDQSIDNAVSQRREWASTSRSRHMMGWDVDGR